MHVGMHVRVRVLPLVCMHFPRSRACAQPTKRGPARQKRVVNKRKWCVRGSVLEEGVRQRYKRGAGCTRESRVSDVRLETERYRVPDHPTLAVA